MRTEDIVGCVFFALVLTGIVLVILGAAKRKNSREARRRIGAGLLVEGLAFLSFGLGTAYLIRTSEKPVVEGNMWGIRQAHFKNRGSSFYLTDEAGRAVPIRCRYDGVGLREGERARVRYVRYNLQLVGMTMLSGPYTGWELEESGGEWNRWVLSVVGIVCLIGAYREWRKVGRLASAVGEAGPSTTRSPLRSG